MSDTNYEVHYTEPAANVHGCSNMVEHYRVWKNALLSAAAAEKSGRYNISIVRPSDHARAYFSGGKAHGWQIYDGHRWIDAP